MVIRSAASCFVRWACIMHGASVYALHRAARTVHAYVFDVVRPARINCKVSGVMPCGVKAKRPPCLCQNPPT